MADVLRIESELDANALIEALRELVADGSVAPWRLRADGCVIYDVEGLAEVALEPVVLAVAGGNRVHMVCHHGGPPGFPPEAMGLVVGRFAMVVYKELREHVDALTFTEIILPMRKRAEG